MNIENLCNKINLQGEIKKEVLDFSEKFDFNSISDLLKDFCNYNKMKESRIKLQNQLKDNDRNIKILSCMLKASCDIYKLYKDKNIDDTIYFDTMKCYTRFISETYEITGKLFFDRFWWTTRQAGFHLFRIGELEYEIVTDNFSKKIISIHIPSDANFNPINVDKSIKNARDFFSKYFLLDYNTEFQCHSWMLDSQLKNMLPTTSNILNFQNRFLIFDKGEISSEILQWIFKTDKTDYKILPENTSLQKNIKKHLLNGKNIFTPRGKLI